MKEELNIYKAYLKKHLLTIRLIERKLDGEELEEFTSEEKQTMRAIYDIYLNEDKSETEEN